MITSYWNHQIQENDVKLSQGKSLHDIKINNFEEHRTLKIVLSSLILRRFRGGWLSGWWVLYNGRVCNINKKSDGKGKEFEKESFPYLIFEHNRTF